METSNSICTIWRKTKHISNEHGVLSDPTHLLKATYLTAMRAMSCKRYVIC